MYGDMSPRASSANPDRANIMKARQASVIVFTDSNDDLNLVDALKMENLNDCVIINPTQAQALIQKLKGINDNLSRLDTLDEEKMPYLFPSDVMMKIVALTPSIKTKIAIISMLGPRLIDPKENMATLIDMFPYSEEKEKVAEVLKSRMNILNASIFKGRSLNPSSGRGGATGRGGMQGRGLAGRPGAVAGRGFTPSISSSTGVSPIKKLLEIDEETERDIMLEKESAEKEAEVAKGISKSITEKRQQEAAKPITIAKVTNTQFIPSSTQSEDPVAKLIRDKEQPVMMTQNTMKRSNDNLLKLSSPEKPVSSSTELSLQASAAILSCMFPNSSTSDGTQFDALEKFRGLLGINDNCSLNANQEWDLKSSLSSSSNENNNIKDEIALVLKALKMSNKEAINMIDVDGWEKYLESNDVFVDEEHIRIEREILSVCKALGIKSFVQQRFSQRLENWEEKVVVEKITQNKNTSSYDDNHGIILSSAKSKMYDDHRSNNNTPNEDTPSTRSIESFSVGTRSPNGSIDGNGSGSPPKLVIPDTQSSFAARVDKYNRVKGLTNEEIIESLLRASREKRVTETLEKSAPYGSSSSTSSAVMMLDGDNHSGNSSNSNSFYRQRLSDVAMPVTMPPAPSSERRLSELHLSSSSSMSSSSNNKQFSLLREVYNTTKSPHEINPGIVRQRSVTFNGGVVVNKRYDEKAAPAAFSLNMDTNSFLSMKPEVPMGFDPVEKTPLFSYKELVRRNHCKDFEGLQHRELEKYLNEEEFQVRFCMTKDQFKQLAKWRQNALKKAVTLF